MPEVNGKKYKYTKEGIDKAKKENKENFIMHDFLQDSIYKAEEQVKVLRAAAEKTNLDTKKKAIETEKKTIMDKYRKKIKGQTK
tara:strand:+ start:304 stop:555 length:252 start_codon:yes stop_codon:yes gene_type:complete